MRSQPSVFLSYSRVDAVLAARLHRDLEARGADVWQDIKDIEIGEYITKAVERGLVTADFFCLLLSKKSINSRWVEQEYRTALSLRLSGSRNIKILPILTEDVELPVWIKDVRYADFRYNYPAAFNELCIALRLPRIDAPFLCILEALGAESGACRRSFEDAHFTQDVLLLSRVWSIMESSARQLESELRQFDLDHAVAVNRLDLSAFIALDDRPVALVRLPPIRMTEHLEFGLMNDTAYSYNLDLEGVADLIECVDMHSVGVRSRTLYPVPEFVSWTMHWSGGQPEVLRFEKFLDRSRRWKAT